MERRSSTPIASRKSLLSPRTGTPIASRKSLPSPRTGTPIASRRSLPSPLHMRRRSSSPLPKRSPAPSCSSSEASNCGEPAPMLKLQRHGSDTTLSSEASTSCEPCSKQKLQRQRSDTQSSEASTCSEILPKPTLRRQHSEDVQEAFIRVVARVRPKLLHEARASDGVEVDLRSHSLTLANSRGGKTFYVDHVFDSRQEEGSQDHVFSEFGQDFVSHSLSGYNVCMFAYGHTGSGKTYTMLGDQSSRSAGNQAGILPRFLQELFAAHSQDPIQTEGRRYTCEFYEVYNEQIKDLLLPAESAERTRKVHVHPKHGVRVENLTMSVVGSADEALRLVHFGNQMRAVAATTMNAHSSRSHAIFTFKHEQQTCEGKSCQSTATFVDLAGREDQAASQNQAIRLREMCCINKSLFHLANVITKLSQGSIDGRSLVDFRNSKLTLLLSPALIGNSRTALIATVAPLRSLVDDSLCTLNFAASVKKIKTRPVINNKAPNTLVAELKAEVRQLQSELVRSKSGEAEKERALSSAQALIGSYEHSWEEALLKSKESAITRQKSLMSLGLADDEDVSPRSNGAEMTPFFTKLSDDPAIQGHCNFFLRDDTLRLGSDEQHCSVILQGLGIMPQMCEVRMSACGGVVIELLSLGEEGVPRVLVDGYPLSPSDSVRRISHGSCVFLGYSHAFRFVLPTHDMAREIGSTDACTLARSTLEKLDVSSAVGEVVDEAGEQIKEILPYISRLSARVADDTLKSFLAALHRICPLIDEANLITKEVFGNGLLRFELHALTNVFKFDNDVPELVVCLLQSSSPQSADGACTDSDFDSSRLLGKGHHPLVHAMGLSEHMRIGDESVLLYVWSLEKFLGRLKAIREIYQEGSEAKDSFQSVRRNLFAEPDQNPWVEIALGDIQLLKEHSATNCSTSSDSDSPRIQHMPITSKECCAHASAFKPRSIGPWQSQGSSGESSSASSLSNEGSTSMDAMSAQSESAWAALGGRVEMLSAEVAQLQETLLHQQAACASNSEAASAKAHINGSKEVSRWLSQVEELRETLQLYSQKLAGEQAPVSAPASPPVTTAADETLRYENVQSLKVDVAKILREELKDQLQSTTLDRVSSSGINDCTSGQRSGSMTPSDLEDKVVYRPKVSCLPTDAHSAKFGPSVGKARNPSRGPSRSSLVSQICVQALPAGAPGGVASKSCESGPAIISESVATRLETTLGKFASLSARVDDKRLSCKPRRPSNSPSRRFVGPYPKVTWAYYEVSDGSNRSRNL